MKRSLIAQGALLCVSLYACGRSGSDVSVPLGQGSSGGSDELHTPEGSDGPPPIDAGGLCGNQIHKLDFDAPNIYFVLDASGSMATSTGSAGTRYARVRKAALAMVEQLGPLINVGAALFPAGATEAAPCHAGREVLSMSPGDPPAKVVGPTSIAFSKATDVVPFGGTPTAATLAALSPTLKALGGRTIVILATDGGPNCNEGVTCTAAECISNIDGDCPGGGNCCAKDRLPGPTMCIDREATSAAVAGLATAGVPVYVVGIPGSEVYGDVLGELALIGGAPAFTPPFYYKVKDLNNLGAVLSTIAAVQVSCSFDLVDAPDAPGFTNVYFDEEVVPYDETDGWRWATEARVELLGEACQKLKSGAVFQVQIVSGCPTEVPR